MKLSAIFSAVVLLGTAQAQTILRQCAVQGGNSYDVVRTDSYTSASCAAAGGVLGTTQGGTIAKGMACCTLSEDKRGIFNDKCRTFSDFPIGTPQPC
ncbi:hypothetical protein CEP53_004550 [Fusarium sp. AF-6]|nr:hypothetical protein CEP53_004550 [Fusarium sp. AF-6]